MQSFSPSAEAGPGGIGGRPACRGQSGKGKKLAHPPSRRAALAGRRPAQVNALPTVTLPGGRGYWTWASGNPGQAPVGTPHAHGLAWEGVLRTLLWTMTCCLRDRRFAREVQNPYLGSEGLRLRTFVPCRSLLAPAYTLRWRRITQAWARRLVFRYAIIHTHSQPADD